MTYVRRIDFGAFAPDRFDFQVLADSERCLIVAVSSPPGCEGPSRHVHASDQLYYVLRGELVVELGGVEHVVPPQSVVVIPEGLPHHNVNRGTDTEVHLDIIVPPPHRGEPLAHPHDSTTGASTRPGAVRTLDPTRFGDGGFSGVSALKGFTVQRLASRETSSDHMQLYVAEVAPGASGPDWHIHHFDQLYFILSGELTVDVADQHVVAGPDSLVYLPAGVPHRNTNAGAVPERHIAMLIPEPRDGEPFDLGVTFSLTGEHL